MKITLRYERGSQSFSHLDPEAPDEALYEVADAMNSLQCERARLVQKTASRRIAER